MAQVFQIVIFVGQENAHFDPQKGPLEGDKKIIKLLACILLSIYGRPLTLRVPGNVKVRNHTLH